jgi:pimeloyl-ACP methyl ester carboxylesterase
VSHVLANGVRLHVQRLSARDTDLRPDAPTVVFLHGLVVDNLASCYYTLANPVVMAGARAILYDLRGHGYSERPPTGYSITDAVADLEGLLAALDVVEPVHLVGYSYGGSVALAYTAAHPERVASLVLIEALFAVEGQQERLVDHQPERDQRTWLRWCERNTTRRVRQAEDLINTTSLLADLHSEPPFPAAPLTAITCPVLAIYGANSPVAHQAHELRRHLPRCELTVLPGCTHAVLVEASAPIRALLLKWLFPEPGNRAVTT